MRKPKKGQDPLDVQSNKDKAGISQQGAEIRSGKKPAFASLRHMHSRAKMQKLKSQAAPNLPDKPNYQPKTQRNPYTESQLGRIKKEAK